MSSAYTSVHNLATHMCHLPYNCHLHSQWARLRHTKVACHIHVSFAPALTETRRPGSLFYFILQKPYFKSKVPMRTSIRLTLLTSPLKADTKLRVDPTWRHVHERTHHEDMQYGNSVSKLLSRSQRLNIKRSNIPGRQTAEPSRAFCSSYWSPGRGPRDGRILPE